MDEVPPFSAHARYAEHTAAKRGYRFVAHDVDGYLFEIGDGRRRAFFSTAAGTPYALNRAHAAAIARDKGFCQTVLACAGLPTIPSQVFFITDEHAPLRSPGRELNDALSFAAGAEYPLFCKPADGSQGVFAEIIADAGQFERYIGRAARKHYAILVQPLIEAHEHRVFVLNGKTLFEYEKQRASAIGDGVSALLALLGERNAPETLRARDQAGAVYCASDVPPKDTVLVVEGAANRALGGGANAPTDAVDPERARLALTATATIGLGLAAVDMFERDDGSQLIIEVNASPAIQTLEAYNRWDLIEAIWSANIEAAFERRAGE